MRRSTTIKETRRPAPENSAIETNCAVSEFCDAEEMPAVFGMTALQFFGGQKTPAPEMSDNQRRGSMLLLAQRQSAAGAEAGRHLMMDVIRTSERVRKCSNLS